MHVHLKLCIAIILAIYAGSIMSMPVTGLAAIGDGWGLALGLDHTVTVPSTTNNASVSVVTHQYPAYIKGINTGLTAIALLLMAGTYYLVISHATPLGNYCKLPSATISASLKNLLEEVWPSAAAGVGRGDEREEVDWSFPCLNSPKDQSSKEADRLLYIGWNSVEEEYQVLTKADDDDKLFIFPGFERQCKIRHNLYQSEGSSFDTSLVRGVSQCSLWDSSQHYNFTRLVWLRNSSVAVKNLVLLAIWEWISLWLVVIMVIGTTIYNGFASGAGNPDRYPRLVLILVYGLTFILHFIYTWVHFCQTLTNLVLNGCWTLLSNARFTVKTAEEIDTYNVVEARGNWQNDEGLAGYESCIFESTRRVQGYRLGHTKLSQTLTADTCCKPKRPGPESLTRQQEAETKNVEKATEVAMERVIFNATILLSISVVTGFSTWTSSQLADATSTQLGSLALLASTASSIAAMLSSAQSLNAMVSASWRYLRMTELIISGKNDPENDKPSMGFTKEGQSHHPVNLWDFWTAVAPSEIVGMFIFGPAFILLPFGKERRENPLETPFQIPVAVGDSRVFFTREENERVTVTLERKDDEAGTAEKALSENKSEESKNEKGKSKETENSDITVEEGRADRVL